MIPLRDVIPSRTVPFVTVALIALNLLCWGFELTLSPEDLERVLREFGAVPAHYSTLTLITSMFLHGGWMHLIGNMLYLWIFGDNVEDHMGHGRFLLFYLLAGGLATLGQIAMTPTSTLPTVGASGAIAGVMGAYLVLYPRSRVLTLVPIFFYIELIEVPAVLLLGFWFLMQLVSAGAIAVTANEQQGGIAFMAHVVGFLVGVGGVFLFRTRRSARPHWM